MPNDLSASFAAPADRPGPGTGVWHLLLTPRIVRSALRVSLLVGTVRNVINGGGQIWTPQAVRLWLAALNVVVAYRVPSYSAVRNGAQRPRGD